MKYNLINRKFRYGLRKVRKVILCALCAFALKIFLYHQYVNFTLNATILIIHRTKALTPGPK